MIDGSLSCLMLNRLTWGTRLEAREKVEEVDDRESVEVVDVL